MARVQILPGLLYASDVIGKHLGFKFQVLRVRLPPCISCESGGTVYALVLETSTFGYESSNLSFRTICMISSAAEHSAVNRKRLGSIPRSYATP